MPIHLDGLILYNYFYAKNKERITNVNFNIEIPELSIDKYESDYGSCWRASALIVDSKQMDSKQHVRRRFNDNRITMFNTTVNNQGFFTANRNTPVNIIVCDRLVSYIRCKIDEIEKYIMMINYLGKYRSAGYGRVQNILIQEQDNDYSLTKNGRATRYIPIPNGRRFGRAMPPYWREDNSLNTTYVGDKCNIH